MKEIAADHPFYILIHMHSYLFHFICFLVKNILNIQNFTYLTLSLANTHGSYNYRHARKRWPNTCTHTFTHKKQKQRKQKEVNRQKGVGGEEKKKGAGGGDRERRGERVQGGRGAWVLRRVGPNINNARSA